MTSLIGNISSKESNFQSRPFLTYSEAFYTIFRPGYGFLTILKDWSMKGLLAKRYESETQALIDWNKLEFPFRSECEVMECKTIMEFTSCK